MKINIKQMALVSMFAALTAVGAFISIPVGPVPITLQTLFVLLSGILIGPKLGALSQIIYIALALIGLPIFSGFSGGPQIILKPSFGFALGFIFAAYIVGIIVHGNSNIKYRLLIGTLLGSTIIYAFGLPYMYYILNFVMKMNLSLPAVLNMGLILFIPGDLVKIAASIFISRKIIPIINLTSPIAKEGRI